MRVKTRFPIMSVYNNDNNNSEPTIQCYGWFTGLLIDKTEFDVNEWFVILHCKLISDPWRVSV